MYVQSSRPENSNHDNDNDEVDIKANVQSVAQRN